MSERVIAHIDMDAFFASVEQKDHPYLKGQPVVVGSDPKQGKGRGVVSTCSYEARRYGIHSAMPISLAYQRCPEAVFLPVRMSRYAEVSDKIFRILYDFTPEIEPVSIDEAFLDITGTYHFYQTPLKTCQRIKQRVYSETGLTASIGIASVKMVAKIASDLCKPDGLLEVQCDKLLDFLWPLKVEKLWGVGPKTKNFLNQKGIETIGDLARFSREQLVRDLGENGEHLFCLAHGLDDRGVQPAQEAKSISQEHTFDQDLSDKKEIEETILLLSEKVSRRLRQDDLKGRTITVKVRFQGFKTYTRASTLFESTNFVDDIYQQAKDLFESIYVCGSKVRLVGVKVSNFRKDYAQENFFDDGSQQKKEDLHKALDSIKDKYGEKAIHRAR